MDTNSLKGDQFIPPVHELLTSAITVVFNGPVIDWEAAVSGER